jgi:hypothetical protein
MFLPTIFTLLLAAGSTTAIAQPGGPADASVLQPSGPPAELSMPPGAETAQPFTLPPEGYSNDAGYIDDSWALGPHRPRFCGTWGGIDSLLWWTKGRDYPPLATTSNAVDQGVLGQPSTVVLFGQNPVGGDARFGGRLTAGVWLDPVQCAGVGFRFAALQGENKFFDQTSDGTTVLARPFFNTLLGTEDALLIGQPGVSNGAIHAKTENDFLTTQVYGRFQLTGDATNRLDMLAGYQMARIDDSFRIASRTNVPAFATSFFFEDRFSTQNEFHGGMLGLMGERWHGRAKISWLGTLALGNMREHVNIAGNGDVNGVPFNGGFFAQPTNIGAYERNRLAFIPELNVNLHYKVTRRLDASIGYSFIYVSSVAFSGNQIDRQLNPSQFGGGPLVGPATPVERFNVTDFWLQGLNFGINWAF